MKRALFLFLALLLGACSDDVTGADGSSSTSDSSYGDALATADGASAVDDGGSDAAADTATGYDTGAADASGGDTGYGDTGGGDGSSGDLGGGTDGYAGDTGSSCLTCKAAGKNCGKIFDKCGNVINCGTCTFPKTCGGGSTTNVCGCVTKWTATAVDSNGYVGAGSGVVVDSAYGVHVAYRDTTNTALKYAYRAQGKVWTTTIVDNKASVGSYPSIALDANKGVHIAYRDDTNQALKYAYRSASGSSWTIKTVDAAKSGGNFTAIQVDEKGGVHIAYHRSYSSAPYVTTHQIKHAYLASGATTWKLEVADTGATDTIDMAVDRDGGIHLVYASWNSYYSTAKLRYSYRTVNGVWGSQTVDTSVKDVGRYSAVAVGATGRVHLSYYDATNGDLKHAVREPGHTSWTLVKVDSTGDVGRYTTIGVDNAGNVRIGYYDVTNKDLKVATLAPGGSWKTASVETQGDVGSYAALAHDSSRDVYITYYDATNRDLKAAFLPNCNTSCTKTTCSAAKATCGLVFDGCGSTLSCTGSCTAPKTCGGGTTANTCGCTKDVWQVEPVDSPGDTGRDTSVAIDTNDGIHISYYDKTNTSLRYAYRKAGGEWDAETVTATGNVGQYSSIAIDSKNGVHIAFRDSTNANLKYAHRAAGATSWKIESVETASGSGLYPAIAVDKSDGVHIGWLRYYRVAPYVNAADIKYAYRKAGGSSWSIVKVDSGDPGYRIGIAVDGSGGIHMSYGAQNTYYSSGKLRYAYKPSGGSWTSGVADSSAKWVGATSSVTVDAVGAVHITHQDVTNKDLKYTTRSSPTGSWTTTSIDTTGDVGAYTAIRADGYGGLHVAYYDKTNTQLKYAYKPLSGSWTTKIVDTNGSVGTFGWLAIDKKGGVHISYYGNNDLLHAYLPKCP